MATESLQKSKKSIKAKIRFIIFAMLIMIIIFFLYNLTTITANAKLGASYAAHVTCSCRYIENRSLEDCQKDFEPGMEIVSLSDDPENKRFTAYVPFLAKAVAERRGEFGCIQLTEEEIDAL